MKVNRFTIRAKITALAVAGFLFLAIVGGVGIQTIRTQSKVSTTAVRSASDLLDLLKLVTDTRGNFRSQVQEWKDTLLRGNDPALYAQYYGAFEKQNENVDKLLKDISRLVTERGLTDIVSAQQIDEMLKTHQDLHDTYLAALKTFNPAHPTAGQEVDRQVRGVDRAFAESINSLGVKVADVSRKQSDALVNQVDEQAAFAFRSAIILLVIALPALVLLSLYISGGIIRNLASFQNTVNQINMGDFDARAKIAGDDELVDLSHAFNQLLDSRVATLAQIEKENEQLNDSVLELLRAVAQLAQKDLTIKVPVSEDVTGAVSDALNLFSSETAKVMHDVSNISADVTSASLKVQQQAAGMMQTALEERAEVEHTSQTLAATAHSLAQIAELARQCNIVADVAIKSTQQALTSVNNTVSGINSTRDVIRETEKRIKRLGERSQEISGAVNLINVIAERTHILALNASMHAASAGEAGRGFAVVADEVQRLAENSRQATQQIAALVNNIQVETADTVNTMNAAISQIVEGSRLAEQAGQQMQQTQQNTSELVASVRQIASNSEEQAKTGQELIELASVIKISSEKTSEKLQDQSINTNNLVEYAKQLLATVRVFKLPG